MHMDQRKTFVHTCRREYRVSGNLKAAEEMLKELPIVKTHNAFLVHMDFLESVSDPEGRDLDSGQSESLEAGAGDCGRILS